MANLKQAVEYAAQNPNSDFAKNLSQLMASGSLDQEAKTYGLDTSLFKTKPEPSIANDLTKRVSNIAGIAGDVGKTMSETSPFQAGGVEKVVKKIGSGIIQGLGQVAGGVSDATVKPIIGGVTDLAKGADTTLGGVPSAIGKAVLNTELGQKGLNAIKGGAEAYAIFAKENPETAKNLEAINEIATMIPLAKPIKAGVELALQGSKEVIGGAVNVAKSGTKSIANTAGAVAQPFKGLSRIPSNISTNVAERKLVESEIKKLPTIEAQNAVRDGLDIVDAKDLTKLATTPQSKKLFETVKKYASGANRDIDPVEIVGEPVVTAFKNLTKKADSIGAKLKAESKNLKAINSIDTSNKILARLQATKGLEGVKLTNGKLDFTDTVIANTPNSIKSIETAFDTASKLNTGSKTHLYRQELFEELGGKKKSLTNLTATEENGLNAIRGGLLDVLELGNPAYKKLSTEYAKITDPINEMKKAFKKVDVNADDDILNMSAGLLARRLTSMSQSNANVRQLLKKIGNATGDIKLSDEITKTQDLYNILNRYYNIAGETGFQKLSEAANFPTGVSDTVVSGIKSVAGKTDAVRQKALEAYLEKLFTAGN